MKQTLDKCTPRRYAELILPHILVDQGFGPPVEKVEAPIPLSFLRPEEVAGNLSFFKVPLFRLLFLPSCLIDMHLAFQVLPV